MKKIIFIIICFLLTGCQYTDLESLTIIKSIGISYDEEYIIHVQLIDEITKEQKVKMKVIESKNSNLEKAIQNIKLQIDKEIYMAHIDLLILDHNLKDNNYQDIINYFLTNNYFRNDFLCVFSKDIKSILDDSQYDEIEKLLETNHESKNTIYKNFFNVMQEYLNNKKITLSNVSYDNEIIIDNNYYFHNNHIERLTNEKN